MTNRQGRLDEAERAYTLRLHGVSAFENLVENIALLATTSLPFTSLAFVAQVVLTTGDACQFLLTGRSARNGPLKCPRFKVLHQVPQFREVAQGPGRRLLRVFSSDLIKIQCSRLKNKHRTSPFRISSSRHHVMPLTRVSVHCVQSNCHQRAGSKQRGCCCPLLNRPGSSQDIYAIEDASIVYTNYSIYEIRDSKFFIHFSIILEWRSYTFQYWYSES